MKVSIRKLEQKLSMILPLSESYQRSYNKLSEDYKSPEEMKLYTRGFFIKKLWKMAQDESSIAAVLIVDDRPCGFIRYSEIPQYYTQAKDGKTSEMEHGMLDGYEFAWKRKIDFSKNIKLDDKTLIVNQIYLDPLVQRHGLGTLLLRETMPDLKKSGFESLIIEYNANNHNAEKFYQTMGFKAFASTKDFDHIIEKNGRTEFCISDVSIAHTTIDNALDRLHKKEVFKNTYITAVLETEKHGRNR